MDIVSERSPTSSPPISPIKLTSHGTNRTPPSNFPTWSRASFERAKLVKALPRDTKDRKIVLESAGVVVSSKHTQTDAKTSTSSNDTLEYKNAYDNQREKLAILEKKFTFVVLHHEDVMTRLRQEVSDLKSENKDLNFRLVMTEGQVSSVQSAYSDEYGRLQCSHCKGPVLSEKTTKSVSNVSQSISSINSASSYHTIDDQGEKQLEEKVLLLKEEIIKLKTALKDAKLKNCKLSQLVEYQQQQQSERLHPNSDLELSHRPEPPVIPKARGSEKKRPGNFGHQPLDRMSRIHIQPRSYNSNQQRITSSSHRKSNNETLSIEKSHPNNNLSVSTNDATDAEDERVQAILQLEELNAQQEQELSQLNHMFLKQRVAHKEIQMRINEKLPPISLDVSPKIDKNFKLPRKKDEICLPILQPVPHPPSTNRNLSDRQKRAKELHVQRQRNNREFSALL